MNKIFSPSTDFNSVRDGRNAPDFFFDLDLSTPFDRFVNIAGNSFYCDANPNDGNFVVYFQETDSLRGPTPFYASPGFIARIPFTQIRVVNATAQPGKKARVVYGTDTDFQPGSVSQVSLDGGVAFVPDGGFTNWVDGAALAAVASIQIFSPASNVRGAIVRNLYDSFVTAVADSYAAFVAQATAPIAPMVPGAICFTRFKNTVGANFLYESTPRDSLYINPGSGLWYIAGSAQIGAGVGARHAQYKLL